MSLDGYIGDRNGGVSWLGGQDPEGAVLDTYSVFIKNVDRIPMRGIRSCSYLILRLYGITAIIFCRAICTSYYRRADLSLSRTIIVQISSYHRGSSEMPIFSGLKRRASMSLRSSAI